MTDGWIGFRMVKSLGQQGKQIHQKESTVVVQMIWYAGYTVLK